MSAARWSFAPTFRGRLMSRCGRAINRRKARTKPPDRDDSPTPVESIPDVDSLD